MNNVCMSMSLHQCEHGQRLKTKCSSYTANHSKHTDMVFQYCVHNVDRPIAEMKAAGMVSTFTKQ